MSSGGLGFYLAGKLDRSDLVLGDCGNGLYEITKAFVRSLQNGGTIKLLVVFDGLSEQIKEDESGMRKDRRLLQFMEMRWQGEVESLSPAPKPPPTHWQGDNPWMRFRGDWSITATKMCLSHAHTYTLPHTPAHIFLSPSR